MTSECGSPGPTIDRKNGQKPLPGPAVETLAAVLLIAISTALMFVDVVRRLY